MGGCRCRTLPSALPLVPSDSAEASRLMAPRSTVTHVIHQHDYHIWFFDTRGQFAVIFGTLYSLCYT